MYDVSHQKARFLKSHRVGLAWEDIQLQLNQFSSTSTTQNMSTSDALTSDVIPAVTELQRLLLKETDEEENYTSVQEHFTDVEQIPLLYSIQGSV